MNVPISLDRRHSHSTSETYERNNDTVPKAVQTTAVPLERQPIKQANDETIDRRKQVATYYKDNAMASYQVAADALNISSKTTVYNDLKWLEKQGVLHVQRDGKTTNVAVNGQYDSFVNG